MPEPLTDAQRDELRGVLEALEVELTDAVKRPSSERRVAQQRLNLVRAALARLRAGEYGLCGECEEPIDFGRLQARPESRLCLACQGAREASRRST